MAFNKTAPINLLKEYAAKTEVIEVVVSGWLSERPNIILFDRLDFLLKSADFQARIDQHVNQWPVMSFLDEKILFVVQHDNIWKRATYKCTTPDNSTLIQLVDSSTVLIYSNELNCRLIQDQVILNEPFCRSKCYLFGVVMPESISPEMIQTYDKFFTNNQLTAVIYSEDQRADRIRFCYFGDFLLQTNDGTISFRNKLLERRLVSLSTIGLKSWVNIHLEELVEELLQERNIAPASIDEIQDIVSTATVTELNSKDVLTYEDVANLPDASEHLFLHSFVGEGGFGEVWFAIYKKNRAKVAIKGITANLKRSELSEYKATNEINILKSLRHENIIELLDVFIDRKSKLSSKTIVMVFPAAEQDLHRYIRKHKDIFPEKEMLQIIADILKGLIYIHRCGIIHRDIKPANILMSSRFAKICDFGLALQPGQYKLTRIGTKNYMAPEMLLDAYDYDSKVDVWGVGCIMAEFMTLNTFFGGCRTHQQLLEYISSKLGTPNDWPELSKQIPRLAKIKGNGIVFMYPTDLTDITIQILQPNPAKRLSAEAALKGIEDYCYWVLNSEIY